MKCLLSSAMFLLIFMGTISVAKEEKKENKLPQEVQAAMDSPGVVFLYSLDPTRKPNSAQHTFHDFNSLGHTKLEPTQAKLAIEAIRAAVAASDGSVFHCFNPHHGMRVVTKKRTYDFVLCYECAQVYIYRDNDFLISLGAAGTSDVLNSLLELAKVPLPYSETRQGRAAIQKEREDRERKATEDHKRWRAATPASLREFSINEIEPYDQTKIMALHEVLKQEIPVVANRCLALFAWYGSGSGPWSGYPAREEIVEILLQKETMQELVAAAQSETLNEAQLEGAARFFVHLDGFPQHAKELQALPNALKKRLLEHSLKSTDKENREWARQAFGK